MNRSTAWHQSTVELMGNCSWRYYLTYVLGLPDPSGLAAQTGTQVHAAVEQYEQGRIDGTPVTMDQMLATACEGLNAEQQEAAKAAVGNWWKAKPKDKGPSHRDWLAPMRPVAIEEYFTFPLVEGAMPIGGTIDGIYLDSDRYRVVDLKTASSMGRWKDSGEGKRLQATMYSVAVQLRYDLDYLPEVTYTVVRTSKTGEVSKRVHVQPDMEDVRVLGDKIRAAQHAVDNNLFVKNPAWNLCRPQWCPHYDGCMVTGKLSGTPETVRLRLSQGTACGPDNSIATQTNEEEPNNG